MTFYLTRSEYRDDGIFGELRDASGKNIAATAEHSYNQLPKVPAGTYTCQRGLHQLEGMTSQFETFEITGVSGHSNILFHSGNWPQIDSAGCVLLGDALAPSSKGQMVTNSRAIFNSFMASLAGVNSFQLIVS